MKDVLIKKGMKILVELSKGLEEPDTAEMYREVYFHHDELCEDVYKRQFLYSPIFVLQCQP